MNAIPLVRVSSFLPFLKFLNHIGSPTDRLLKQANLSAFVIHEPEGLIPLYQGFSFVEVAARIEDINVLGLEVGRHSQIADLGVLGHVVQQSLTLYDLLNTLQRVIHLNNSCAKIWLTEETDRVWIHHQFACSPALQSPQAQLFAVLMLIKAIQLVTGKGWHPAALRLRSKGSRKLTETEEFGDVPMYFNQDTNAIAISKQLLAQPLQKLRASQTLSPQECYHHLQTTAPSADFLGSLQQLLHTLLKEGYPDISLAAAATGTSVRSFQRRLAAAHLNYSRIVEQVRFDRAVELLSDPSIKSIDIALELGYTDAANFTRAFKRWTGVSPREFRHSHMNR
ncbi:AraC family transcriptional regulator [filamentous cyanobacterium CCP1]|nr:AraC family transcriptional regulator [filamentous cyanobacterium CCP2]PSB64638.1 AraC family transcriptional regulator [filamentous cyanobacterium CCP1]